MCEAKISFTKISTKAVKCKFEERLIIQKMKIFVYNSSRKEKSSTEVVIKQFIKFISEELNIECDNYNAINCKISQCQGCEKCFKFGFCPLDKVDFMEKIKMNLKKADVIILGTPVYSAMVSGNMKNMIDRLSYYLHRFEFRKKIIIPVISASGNSLIDTNVYFKKIIESWGAFVPFSIMFTVDAPNMLKSEEFMNEKLKIYAKKIVNYYNGKEKITASDYQELYFKQLKKIYSIPTDTYEFRYWDNYNLNKYSTYQEIIDTEI